MSIALASTLGPEAPSSLADLARWLRRGWQLFRAAPLRGCLLALGPVVLEAVVQAIPVAGVVLSKLLVSLAAAWVLALLHRRAAAGDWGARSATAQWWRRGPALLRMAIVLAAAAFGVQMLVLAALAGVDQAIAVALGDLGALRLERWQIAGMLASGLVPSIALLFAPGQVLFSGRSTLRACADSLRAVAHRRAPMLGLAALTAPMLVSAAWAPMALLLFLPFGLYVGYAAWEDVFARGRTGEAG